MNYNQEIFDGSTVCERLKYLYWNAYSDYFDKAFDESLRVASEGSPFYSFEQKLEEAQQKILLDDIKHSSWWNVHGIIKPWDDMFRANFYREMRKRQRDWIQFRQEKARFDQKDWDEQACAAVEREPESVEEFVNVAVVFVAPRTPETESITKKQLAEILKNPLDKRKINNKRIAVPTYYVRDENGKLEVDSRVVKAAEKPTKSRKFERVKTTNYVRGENGVFLLKSGEISIDGVVTEQIEGDVARLIELTKFGKIGETSKIWTGFPFPLNSDKYVVPNALQGKKVYATPADGSVQKPDVKPLWQLTPEEVITSQFSGSTISPQPKEINENIRKYVNNLNDSELKTAKYKNNGEDWDKLTDTYNANVAITGVSSYEEHVFRNKLNREPETLTALLAESNKWDFLLWLLSLYHKNGANGEFNLKFVSKDGKFEAVYKPKDPIIVNKINKLTEQISSKRTQISNIQNPSYPDGSQKVSDENFKLSKLQSELHKLQDELRYAREYMNNSDNWELVTDPLNMGTYNYANPLEAVNHAKLDIATYKEYGNIDKENENITENEVDIIFKYLGNPDVGIISEIIRKQM
jgi:hypothetical protein